MSVSFLSVVLTSAVLAGQGSTPSWQTSYSQAQEIGAAQKKPLAVVFGSGSNGWTKIAREATPGEEVSKLLAEKYVCVYVDTTTPAGKKLAQDFAVTQATGLILSDRAGSLQAFWHQGDLPSQSLASYLRKYSDPQVVVRGTETASRTSFYPADGAADSNWGTSSPFGSSYCPNCNNVRGRR